MGQSFSRAGAGNNGGLEAHRRDGGREDRQVSPDVCAGRLGRDRCDGDDRLADVYGLPVSTTHVFSSGVAGTMAANGSGLQWSTVRSLLTAWVLTLPAAILLAGFLYYIFANLF